MKFDRLRFQSIYLYRHPVDMRKGSDGLAILAKSEMALDPCSETLFVFLNKARNKLKLLLWERNGFWVFYKKLERQRFAWPDWFDNDALSLSSDQCDLLIQGFNLNAMRPHSELKKVFYL